MQSKFCFNLKFILKIVSGLMAILWFVPSFMVSCGNTHENYSAMNIAFGVNQTDLEVHTGFNPFALLVFLVPIAMLVIWFVIKNTQLAARNNMILSAADFVLWLIVLFMVKAKVAELNEGEEILELSVKAGFTFSVILSIAMGVLCFLIFKGKMDADKALIGAKQEGFVPGPQADPQNWQAPDMGAQAPRANSFCTGCGKPLAPETKFCTSCGKPVENQ